MNRTEIEAKWSTLTARERDAWVAEVIFGYYWADLFPHMKSVEKIRMLTAPIGDAMRNVGGRVDSYGIPESLPNYTSDISAAWAVLESSRAWGGMGIGYYTHGYDISTYTDSTPNQKPVKVTKPTAPEAICLAVLIAKLTEVS